MACAIGNALENSCMSRSYESFQSGLLVCDLSTFPKWFVSLWSVYLLVCDLEASSLFSFLPEHNCYYRLSSGLFERTNPCSGVETNVNNSCFARFYFDALSAPLNRIKAWYFNKLLDVATQAFEHCYDQNIGSVLLWSKLVLDDVLLPLIFYPSVVGSRFYFCPVKEIFGSVVVFLT